VVLDAAARHDLTVITGSPAKLWIAALSIAYDLIFVAQHYSLYSGADEQQQQQQSLTAASSAVKPVADLPAAIAPTTREAGGGSGGVGPRAAVLAFSEVGRRWVGGRKQ